jgi:hypothetical protein
MASVLRVPPQMLQIHILSIGLRYVLQTKVKGFFSSTQRYYNRFYYYYSRNCYMFRSYDHLQAEIYLLEFTLFFIYILRFYNLLKILKESN